MYENLYWGAEASNSAVDPNPRLLANISAARRGAKVRVLLDAYFDNQHLNSSRSNLRTVEYPPAVAQAEGLDMHSAPPQTAPRGKLSVGYRCEPPAAIRARV